MVRSSRYRSDNFIPQGLQLHRSNLMEHKQPKPQDIDLDNFVRKWKNYMALWQPEPDYEELEPSFNTKEKESTDAYS
jgi:hypothetical protein